MKDMKDEFLSPTTLIVQSPVKNQNRPHLLNSASKVPLQSHKNHQETQTSQHRRLRRRRSGHRLCRLLCQGQRLHQGRLLPAEAIGLQGSHGLLGMTPAGVPLVNIEKPPSTQPDSTYPAINPSVPTKASKGFYFRTLVAFWGGANHPTEAVYFKGAQQGGLLISQKVLPVLTPICTSRSYGPGAFWMLSNKGKPPKGIPTTGSWH